MEEVVSAVLTAEPNGMDYVVTFDCGCVLKFWGEYGSEHTWLERCAGCLGTMAYSTDRQRMYAAAVKQRDAFNAARRRDEAEIVTR